MPNWRDYILRHFQEPLQRLTLVADPDGLMLEEELLATIRQNGFDLLTFEDHVAFRFAYESRYRHHWDEGQGTDLVVILRSPSTSLSSLPYDLLSSGRLLAFGLPELFPLLSYPVVAELDVAYLQRLYDAYAHYRGPEMGDRATGIFVLKHVFGIEPDLIRGPADLLKMLLSRHVRGERIPPRASRLLVEFLRHNARFDNWPLAGLVQSGTEFLQFLQQRWLAFLAAQQPAQGMARELSPVYDVGEVLPFDDPDVRAYVDTLFLEGKLRPVRLPEGWQVQGWAQVGVEVDKQEYEHRRYAGLLAHLHDELPAADSTHKQWQEFARSWAELTVLHHRLAPNVAGGTAGEYRSLHSVVETRFAEWMESRYNTLHSLPFLPIPTMNHHIPHYMAAKNKAIRQALIVVDGLALDQWLIVREAWAGEGQPWRVQENTVFAWVPTLTSISRQAIVAGDAPQYFPNAWQTTQQEPAQWARFWRGHGLPAAGIGYEGNLGVKDVETADDLSCYGEIALEARVEEVIDDPHMRALVLIVNTVDKIMHGMQLGMTGMHQQVALWLTRHRYLTTLVDRLLEASFTVYLTSDHGNVWTTGMGRPKEGVLVETRGQRARVYSDRAYVALAKKQLPAAAEWTNAGLPESAYVLLAPQLSAFLDAGERAVCHGGIALEEVIVPFVEISRETGQ